MQIYLPIAEISVNVFILLGLGSGIGVLSGLADWWVFFQACSASGVAS